MRTIICGNFSHHVSAMSGRGMGATPSACWVFYSRCMTNPPASEDRQEMIRFLSANHRTAIWTPFCSVEKPLLADLLGRAQPISCAKVFFFVGF